VSMRYWLVEVDNEFILDNGGDYTTLKTRAGRLRDADKSHMTSMMISHGFNMDVVTFVPTTYKPGDVEFIEPNMWDWMHRR